MRPLHTYAKVQHLYGHLIRGKQFQLLRPRIRKLDYLHVGCGSHIDEHFINVDYQWWPGLDLCWDIRGELPFPDARFKGVFSEHCLEHFSLDEALTLMRAMHRILLPGGRVRLVVPDAGLYMGVYQNQMSGDSSSRFPFQTEQEQHPAWTPLMSVNHVFYQDRDSLFGHRNLFDAASMTRMLSHVGFSDVRQVAYREGGDSTMWIEQEHRRCESLYMEAIA